MKQKILAIILIVIGLVLINSYSVLCIEWEKPIGTAKGNSAKFIADGDNIEVYIKTTQNDEFWHIQSISKKPLPIKEKNKYRISFEAISNKSFDLFSRLGEHYYEKGNSYIDHKWRIEYSDKWMPYSYDFLGYGGKNYLYFQFGFAPQDTVIKIRNISITEIP